MDYIIKNKSLKNYFLSENSWGFHFVVDIDESFVFKNKWDANRMLKKMKNLREYPDLTVIPKKVRK